MCACLAPQGSDLRVLEHGSDCLATVDANVVVVETASEGRSGGGERTAVFQRELTERQTLRPTAHISEVTELPLSPSHSLVMPSAV